MALARRYLEPQVLKDVQRKMVFIAGPRQVGKTTLARQLPGAARGYLNWDVAADRERILRGELPASALWIFDEIHKYRSWRAFLKGIYDRRRPKQRIVVAERRNPVMFVEAKWSDTPVDRGLRYLKARFPRCDAWQVSATGRKDFVSPEGIRVAPALDLLQQLA